MTRRVRRRRLWIAKPFHRCPRMIFVVCLTACCLMLLTFGPITSLAPQQCAYSPVLSVEERTAMSDEGRTVLSVEERTVVSVEQRTVLSVEERTVLSVKERTVLSVEERTVVSVEERTAVSVEERTVVGAGDKVNEQLADVVARLDNLPPVYGQDNPPRAKGNKCAKHPSLFDLSFRNLFWQVLHSSNGTFYLYSAFLDNRTAVLQKPSIRILGMIDRVAPSVTTHCQLWYEGEGAPVVVRVSDYKYIWFKWFGNYKNGILQPYLMACSVPPGRNHSVPQSVSLVEGRCDKPTNNLRVVNNMPKGGLKENFAVCVKGMSGSRDNSVRLAEWLELLFLLGADKVFLYDLGVHPNVAKMLKVYQSRGKVDVKRLTLPGDQPNFRGLLHRYLENKVTHKRQNEVIPYNDCLYRNMNLYKFVVLPDTDEVIMPKTALNWTALMEQVAPEAMAGRGHPVSSYVARHVYFLDGMQEKHGWAADVPRFMHMLQHVHRAANYTAPGAYVKCLHDPQRVETLHNHFPVSCLGKGCPRLNIPVEIAHLQHYRKWCVRELSKKCGNFVNNTVRDDAILRFREPLVSNALQTLRQTGLVRG